jgi:hypothetical protein
MQEPEVVPMLDPIEHTADHPFCDDMECLCHEDVALMEEHQFRPYAHGLLTMEEARRLFQGKQL